MNELYFPFDTPIHRMNASVKLILTLVFLIFLSLTSQRDWPVFAAFYLLLLAAEYLSGISFGFFVKRAFVALPFILAAAPLIFSGPAPLTHVTGPGGLQISISLAGLERFASLAVKSWISVQAAILLAATTRYPDLLAAMCTLKTPAIFVSILALMGRYLSVIIAEAQSLLRARASRSPSRPGKRAGGSLAWRAGVAGGLAGSLFLRSLERSDRVYAAMLSRGYNGDLPLRSTPALVRKDIIAIVIGLAFLIALVVIPSLL